MKQDLLTEVGDLVHQVTGPHNDVSERIQLLMTLWWLANRETFRQVDFKFSSILYFNILNDTVLSVYQPFITRFCRLLTDLAQPGEMFTTQ